SSSRRSSRSSSAWSPMGTGDQSYSPRGTRAARGGGHALPSGPIAVGWRRRLQETDLNRCTPATLLHLSRAPLPAAEGVPRAPALQAQEPVGPSLAHTARLEGFAPEDLDAAYAAGAVARSTLLRMTIHAVSAEDSPTLYGTMHKRLRGARLGDPRFTKTG